VNPKNEIYLKKFWKIRFSFTSQKSYCQVKILNRKKKLMRTGLEYSKSLNWFPQNSRYRKKKFTEKVFAVVLGCQKILHLKKISLVDTIKFSAAILSPYTSIPSTIISTFIFSKEFQSLDHFFENSFIEYFSSKSSDPENPYLQKFPLSNFSPSRPINFNQSNSVLKTEKFFSSLGPFFSFSLKFKELKFLTFKKIFVNCSKIMIFEYGQKSNFHDYGINSNFEDAHGFVSFEKNTAECEIRKIFEFYPKVKSDFKFHPIGNIKVINEKYKQSLVNIWVNGRELESDSAPESKFFL